MLNKFVEKKIEVATLEKIRNSFDWEYNASKKAFNDYMELKAEAIKNGKKDDYYNEVLEEKTIEISTYEKVVAILEKML